MIRFSGVKKAFGSHQVLDDLTLHIRRGKITFIVGKSGEGKSVTIKHIMGLMKPDSGYIEVDGLDISTLDERSLREYRKSFGMLFQHAALFDSMTVGQNVMFPLKEQPQRAPLSQRLRRVEEVLEQVGLPHIQHKYPAQLSTGEKKRVGLARALATRPRVLLYDEPTTGMDPLVCEMIDDLIVQLNREEKEMTSIVISHDLKAAMATAEHIVMLYKGQAALEGTPKDFSETKHPVVQQFFSGRVDGPMEFF